MAKQLKDILKQAHDTIKGTHKSTTQPLSVGKDPGVDLTPKAGDDVDFIAKHSVEKWDEPYGNPNYADKIPYTLSKEKHHGNTISKAKAANEEVEIDEGMSASTIKHKQKISHMSNQEFAMKYKDRSDAELRSMAWRHGYGKPGTAGHDHYVNLRKKGMSANEEVQIDELSTATMKSYRAAAKDDKKDAERQASLSDREAADTGRSKQSRKEFKDESKWLKGIAAKRAKGIAMASKKLGEETEVSESKKAEDTKCNMTEAGTWCPIHEMADCSSARTIKEKDVTEGKYNWDKEHRRGLSDTQGNRMLIKRSMPKAGPSKEELRKLASKATHVGAKIKEAIAPGQFVEPSSAAKAQIKANQQKDADTAAVNRAKMGIVSVDEISNKTRASYIQGATRDALKMQYALGKGEKVDTRKLMNRRKGIDKAADKMAEEVQIDEDGLKARERLTPHIKKDEYGKKTAHKHLKTMIKSMKGKHGPKGNLPEEVEQIDELSTDTYHRAAKKAANKAMWDPEGRSGKTFKKYAAKAEKFRAKGMEQEKKERSMKEEVELDEKHLTPAEMKKREEVAQAIHRENPKMPMAKKMAIATATAKKVAEEVLNEKLTDDAKKNIQQALGPRTPKNPLRTSSSSAKAMIGIAKMNPKNVKEDLAQPLLGGDPPRGYSDEAAEMVKTELKALANKAMHLVMQMPDSMHVEPWCQAKIAQAKELVSSVHDYMIYGDHDKPEEDEGTMDTPMTFPNMSVDVNTGQNV